MKNKSKDQRQSQQEKQLNIDLNWEKLADMEASLRKVVNTQLALPFSQESIELLLKFTRQVLRCVEALKSQQKYYGEIQENYNTIQTKLSNHDSIVNSLEQQHINRYKSLSDEIKVSKEFYEKAKKNLQEMEEQAKVQTQQIRKQNHQLKFKVELLTKEKQELQTCLQAKQKQLLQLHQHHDKFTKVATTFSQASVNIPKLESILCSNLSHRIVNYLAPCDILNLEQVSKQCRVYMRKSKTVQDSLCRSIVGVKNRNIAYFHRHIDHFEKLYHKIPEEILQTTFYKYHILKATIGTEILSVLNSSAMLFEGKFQDINQDEMADRNEEDGSKRKAHIEVEKQIENLREFQEENPTNVLEIDHHIIREFLEDHQTAKQKQAKEISCMYWKIKTTAQLYSVDVESIGKFITNILINFSKVFVLSKNLYTEARNLQSLNTLILHQLTCWNKMQVQKNSQIEDLKAQLEAEKKLKVFFTNESIKSEQRALSEQNMKLVMESKFNKQIEKLDSIVREKEELSVKLAESQKELKNLKSDNREIRKAYEAGRDKYNKILEELSVVKETILRMNIV